MKKIISSTLLISMMSYNATYLMSNDGDLSNANEEHSLDKNKVTNQIVDNSSSDENETIGYELDKTAEITTGPAVDIDSSDESGKFENEFNTITNITTGPLVNITTSQAVYVNSYDELKQYKDASDIEINIKTDITLNDKIEFTGDNVIINGGNNTYRYKRKQCKSWK